METTTLKEAIDQLPGGLLITDTESRVLYASAALKRRTGFSVAEIVGKKPGQLWGGKMPPSFYRTLWQTISTERKAFVGQVENTKKNGTHQSEHIFIVPIVDQKGKPVYFAEVHPDLRGRESEVAFGREFLLRTDGAVQDQNFFSWVFQSLSKKEEGRSISLPSMLTWEHRFEGAAELLYSEFIVPTEKVFARRKEDALLVADAQEHPEHFALLYEKYPPLMREYFLRRLEGDLLLAEDLTQETFVRAFRYLPGFHMANASYATYLLRVAHSVLVNSYRKERYETVSLSGNENEGMEVMKEEEYLPQNLDTLLAPYSEIERVTMFLKYRDGLKVKDIALRIGKTENAVKLILSRTRKKLKKELQ